jgi:hypothetical protein
MDVLGRCDVCGEPPSNPESESCTRRDYDGSPCQGRVVEYVRADLHAGAVALLREVRAAGAPEGWPVGRRVRWMQEVDALLDGGQ